MTMLAAIAVTALIVGLSATLLARRSTTNAIHQAISGRAGSNPVDEHRRLLQEATRHASEATAQSDLLQLSLDALTSGVIVTNLAGRVLVRNRLATNVSTQSHERTLIEVASSELLSAAMQGDPAEREIAIFGPPPRSLFIHAVPISSDGQIVGALAVIDDVTEQRRIEKTRRDFIANLSHELRTPVGAASLLGEMLVDESDASTRKQLTDRLLIETDRMTATIDDLLRLSRIESEEQTYDDDIDLQQLIGEAVERTKVAAETSAVVVGTVGPTDPLCFTGSHDQILTAVVNLLENAIKYSSSGDSVSVRSRIDEATVVITVQDTGRGIPARDLDRVFERFYRVDRSRDSATGGTGIGLSIVRHVALNHGGTVAVASFEGEGSTFTMTLPIADARHTADSEPAPLQSSHDQPAGGSHDVD